jgi:hypothetical protein
MVEIFVLISTVLLGQYEIICFRNGEFIDGCDIKNLEELDIYRDSFTRYDRNNSPRVIITRYFGGSEKILGGVG